MTATLLNELISSHDKCGIYVVAVVSDMGGKNNNVWRQLGITLHETLF